MNKAKNLPLNDKKYTAYKKKEFKFKADLLRYMRYYNVKYYLIEY